MDINLIGIQASLPTKVGNALKYLQVNAGESALVWTAVSSSNLGSSDLTSSANARVFNLNGNTTSNYLQFKNQAGNGVLKLNGALCVWANGSGAVQSNTTFGEEALDAAGIYSDNNTAFGYKSLTTVGNAGANSAFGSQSLRALTVGQRNSAFGCYAGDGSTGAEDNASFGYYSGRVLGYGYGNSFFGGESGYNATNNYNSFFGYRSGWGVTTGDKNILIGARTATSTGITTGTGNIVIGNDVSTGNVSNTAILGDTGITKTILRGTINIANTPTSSAGLSAGDIWNNSGVLNIV